MYTPRTIDILAFLYTIGYFTIVIIAFFQPFPDSNRDVLNVLLGILSMVMVKIVEAYFNKDSANSATATAIRTMNEIPTNAPTVTQGLLKDPIKVETVNVDATTANVTEKKS